MNLHLQTLANRLVMIPQKLFIFMHSGVCCHSKDDSIKHSITNMS